MTAPVRLRATSAAALKLKWYANKLGAALHRSRKEKAVRSGVYDGFIFKGSKSGGRVRVDVLEVPGRLVGSNSYRDTIFDSMDGESTIDGVIESTSPLKDQMAPTGEPATELRTEERPGSTGTLYAFGEPLPEGAHCILASWSTEVDGGVVMVQKYTAVEPERNASGDYIILEQEAWLVVMVKWAGAGPARSVSFSDTFMRDTFGGSILARMRYIPGTETLYSPVMLNGGLPVAHYVDGALVIAIETSMPGPTDNDVRGGMVALCVGYGDEGAQIVWSRAFEPDDFGPDLSPDLLPAGGSTPYKMAGLDLPAIFSWRTDAGLNTALSFRLRSWRTVDFPTTTAARIVTAQAFAVLLDGAGTLSVDYADSVSGADSGLPQQSAETAYIQKFGDIFFLDADGQLVRHRCMRLLARVASDSDMGVIGRSSTLNIAESLALLRTESVGGVVMQTQLALGYGPEELPAGTADNNNTNGFAKVRFATPVGAGEVWSFGFINGAGMAQIGIARITSGGVAPPLAAGIGRSLYLSTYQREVKDENGVVVTPMAQLATYIDVGAPKAAIKRGRFGSMDFLPAASFSRQGTFYLASPADIPRYGRIFG